MEQKQENLTKEQQTAAGIMSELELGALKQKQDELLGANNTTQEYRNVMDTKTLKEKIIFISIQFQRIKFRMLIGPREI